MSEDAGRPCPGRQQAPPWHCIAYPTAFGRQKNLPVRNTKTLKGQVAQHKREWPLFILLIVVRSA